MVVNDAKPVVLASSVSEQLAPVQHRYVKEVPMNLTPECGLRVSGVEQCALHFAVAPSAMERQIAHETTAQLYDAPSSFIRQQWRRVVECDRLNFVLRKYPLETAAVGALRSILWVLVWQ
jgi:hypothetical protein